MNEPSIGSAPPNKPVFKSKTALANLIVAGVTALAYTQPAAKAFIESNAGLIISGLNLLNIGLRFITRGRVTLFGD